MRKLLALAAVGTVALLGGQAVAADMPEYPTIDVPDVDYDVGGSFYLRGSAALNLHWAPEVVHPWDADDVDPIVEYGYGYSWGAGFGYETGTGLRFDWNEETRDNGDKVVISTSSIFGVKKVTWNMDGTNNDFGVFALDTAAASR